MTSDRSALTDLIRRLWVDARATADEAAGQASLARAARMLGVRLVQEGALDVVDDWTPVDAHHDFVEQRWREMGMLPLFEWVAVWSPEPISSASDTVDLCVIRRRHPQPNGATLVRVPFEKLRAAEGFTFHVIGVIVPFAVSRDYWQLDGLVFEALDMRIGIGAVAEVFTTMTPTSLDEVTRCFDLAAKPDAKTLARARRALTMRPRIGRPPGSGTYRSESKLRAVIDPIVRELRRQQRYPSRERVAEHMPGDVDPKLLGRWVRKLIELDWAAYLDTVI